MRVIVVLQQFIAFLIVFRRASASGEQYVRLTERRIAVETNLVSFAQDRIAMAHSEQLWAVALVGAMNAFIASHSKRLLGGFQRWVLVSGVSVTSIVALLFIWSRHFIFMHYDDLAKAALGATVSGSPCPPDRVAPYLVFIAAWSGVCLYSLVVIGAATIATRMLFSSPTTIRKTP